MKNLSNAKHQRIFQQNMAYLKLLPMKKLLLKQFTSFFTKALLTRKHLCWCVYIPNALLAISLEVPAAIAVISLMSQCRRSQNVMESYFIFVRKDEVLALLISL